MNLVKTSLLASSILALAFVLSNEATAQSGSRGYRGRGNSQSGQSVRDRQLDQQRKAILAQENARRNAQLRREALIQQRMRLLANLGSMPDGTLNRRMSRLAFEEAKAEFVALKAMNIPLSAASRQLEQIYRLSSKELNRATKMIVWPDSLQADKHAGLIKDFESKVESNEETAEELLKLIQQLNLQLGERAVSNRISAVNYARAKRFLSGLAHEVNSTKG